MRHADVREIQTASLTDVGQVRANNQDVCAEFENDAGARLLVVADGMGGHAGGEVASRTAVEAIGEVFRNGGADQEELLRSAFKAANERIQQMAAEAPELQGMGTTAVALLLGPGPSAWVAHVGDSRAYRLRRGRLEVITQDHSWVFEEIRARRLTPEQAEVHPYRNALMRSIGVDPGVEVDVARIPIEAGDRFLLCSDGLWGELDHDTMADVATTGDPRDCVQRLVELANISGGHDNVTVQLAALPGGQWADPRDAAAPPTTGPGPLRRRPLAVLGAAGAALLLGVLLWLALGARG